ncbi:hypothetical protein ACC736_32885 [Rhizobium ruizarguesonis]
MSDLDTLADRIKLIALEVQKNPRVNPDNDHETGWGQFIDAPAHSNQIGPYGTCAALLLLSLALPQTSVPETVKAQLRAFWDEPPASNKLTKQTVRLAFLALCFAKTTDASLATLRDEAIKTLLARQLSDGGWSDAWHEETIHQTSKTDATAWVVLALLRAGSQDRAAKKGAEFIQYQLTDDEGANNVSAIAVAAATSALPTSEQTSKLRKRAALLLKTSEVTQEEHISFFDYAETTGGKMRLARDYLCFPAFYSQAHILTGLQKTKNPLKYVWVRLHRIRYVERLLTLVPLKGGAYRLPGASFAATVDQAIIGLVHETLEQSPTSFDLAFRILRPISGWLSGSVFIHVVVPILVIAVAVATTTDIQAVPKLLKAVTDIDTPKITEFLGLNADAIRIVITLFLVLVPSLPSYVWGFIRKKFD